MQPYLAAFAATLLLVTASPSPHSPSHGRPPSPCSGRAEESHQVVNGSASFWPYQSFRSAPFNPPELLIEANGQPLAPGLIFISPSNFRTTQATKDVAPIIMTDTGQLIWNGPQGTVGNFRVQTYKKQPILTYWGGLSTEGANVGHGYGNVTFLDTSYNEILTVCPRLGLVTPDDTIYQCELDFHESTMTDRDTILISTYNVTPTDLSTIGGPKDGWVYDNVVFEIDPPTGNILFEWRSLDHVPVSATKQPLLGTGMNKSVPFDYFHINTIDPVGLSYLVNGRHTWSTYLVGASGKIQWTLEGSTGGDFGPLPAEGQFSWQHDARVRAVTKDSITISYFNNYNSAVDTGKHPSNGLYLRLPLPPNKSKSPVVVTVLEDPDAPIYANSQGSDQLLPGGNHILGYGQIPIAREFGPTASIGTINSNIRWQARFGADSLVQSYRVFKQRWHGYPTTKPSLVVEPATEGTCNHGYVSWNGATEVEAWAIYEGSCGAKLHHVGLVPYKGFETRFRTRGPCVAATAKLRNGQQVRSEVVKVG